MTMTMSMSTRHKRLLGGLVVIAALTAAGELTGSGPLLLGGGEAHAVIGRPLTPMSYAGVARRTTRRAAYAGAYAGAAAAPVAVGTAAAVPSAGVVTALPAGCGRADAGGGVYYQCGAVRYQPYYYGSQLVYRPL
ncbi:MAG TPA: hypothetical protein VHW23_33790 [Kofleriaceae bacterium]|jgi:hypothetical protein|nr:hypothetical protein [Kofleriaceae bacterium]